MPNYRAGFEADVEAFLSKYATMVSGGSVQLTGSGTTVGAEINSAGFTPTQKTGGGGTAKSAVSLTAPLLTATFVKSRPRDHKDYFDFSAAQITIQLDRFNAPTDLPVYLIPYEGGTGRGVKLPAHGSDPHAVAYAMTATQNGCTVEVSGNRAEPYASHTNVIDVSTGAAADQKWADREAKINLRLARLQARFAAAEAAAGGDPNAPATNRTQFGFYDPSGAGGVPAGQFVNYQAQAQKVANAQANVAGKTAVREEGFLSHFRYYAVPTDQVISDCRNRRFPPQALVVGRRDAGGWTFYYQVWRPMQFYIKRVRKVHGLKLGEGEYLLNGSGNREKFSITAILDYGELWPNHTEHNNTFGAGL
jgi:hypothetical protein